MFASSILGFIQNEKGIVERTPAHERQRRNLDNPALLAGGKSRRPEHVAQGVVQGAQIGVDLFFHIARQKAEFFACLHSRPGQHNAFDPPGRQHGQSHGHGKVGLARSGRPYAEHHLMGAQGVHINALRRISGQDVLARSDNNARITKQLLYIGKRIPQQRFIPLQQILAAQFVAAFEQTISLSEQAQQKLPQCGVGRGDGKFSPACRK